MTLFDLPNRKANKVKNAKVIERVKQAQEKGKADNLKEALQKGSAKTTLADKIEYARQTLEMFPRKELLHQIREDDEFVAYVDEIINVGACSIDVEASSKDPMTAQFAGLCLYTEGQKAVYVPYGHKSYITQQKAKKQVSHEVMKEQIQRLVDHQVFTIMFYAKYEMHSIRNTFDVKMHCSWDCHIAAKMLNENEESHSLAHIYNKYIGGDGAVGLNFGDVFKGIEFNLIPINIAYVYGANDALITWELYKFQEPFLTPGTEENVNGHLEGVANVFHNIEMKVLPVVADMEWRGVRIDMEYAAGLKKKYQKLQDDAEAEVFKIVEELKPQIDAYNQSQGQEIIQTPINIQSPKQLAALLYDVLGLKAEGGKRSTAVGVLKTLEHPIAKAILDYRAVATLLSTFVDALPAQANPKTGRIHANFNQNGTVTGRLSSSGPNLQNIPSRKGKDIRGMFAATEGYAMISSDYKAQEPRITTHLCQDERMIKAYKEGKDLYVEIASAINNLPYEECTEFREDGTYNPAGDRYRNEAKAIVLGVTYGKGVKAIGEDLGISFEEAYDIYDRVMTLFAGLPAFIEETQKQAEELGYVETIWGRKRRLPEMQLPRWDMVRVGPPKTFNPLDFGAQDFDEYVSDEDYFRYYDALMATEKLRFYDKLAKQKEIIAEALEDGIKITDNEYLIARARRQCVNSRVQGSAGDQTKVAMVLIDNDPILNELGYRLLLQVHDELIGEAPLENIAAAAKRKEELMIKAGEVLTVPTQCDIAIFERWEGEELNL